MGSAHKRLPPPRVAEKNDRAPTAPRGQRRAEVFIEDPWTVSPRKRLLGKPQQRGLAHRLRGRRASQRDAGEFEAMQRWPRLRRRHSKATAAAAAAKWRPPGALPNARASTRARGGTEASSGGEEVQERPAANAS
ncbi:hypothetical protein MTO96_013908 [Rhipicephalus appendiculatus]